MSEKRVRSEIAIDHQEGRVEMQLWTMVVFVENRYGQRDIHGTRWIAVISDGETQGIRGYRFAVDRTVHGDRHENDCLRRRVINEARGTASALLLPATYCSSP